MQTAKSRPLVFTPSRGPTLGAELEVWLTDPETRDIVPRGPDVLNHFGEKSKFKPELFSGIVEINTGVCRNISELRADLSASIEELVAYGDKVGFAPASSGTHPFANYHKTEVSKGERYTNHIARIAWPMRRLLICGLHIHVGVDSGEKAIAILNALPAFFPHMMAVASSSPYWQGNDTGMASSRLKIFETLPTAGLPPVINNWNEFVRLMRTLVNAEAIKTVREIWWDVRPHLEYGTIEVRICDAPPTLDEVIAVAGFIHALVGWLGDLYDKGHEMPSLREWTLKENKWRAARWGRDANMIRNERGLQESVTTHLRHMVYEVTPMAETIDAVAGLEAIETILTHGPSYERQRRVFERTHDLRAVVDALAYEFRNNKPDPRGLP